MGLFGRRDDKPPTLVPIPAIADLPQARLEAAAKYLGTVDADGERVIGQGLSARSSARLNLSREALDVVRMAGSFRIPVAALRGARTGERFLGRPVPSLLVVAWRHGEHDWETGFRLEELRSVKGSRAVAQVPRADEWVRALSKLSREQHPNNSGSSQSKGKQ